MGILHPKQLLLSTIPAIMARKRKALKRARRAQLRYDWLGAKYGYRRPILSKADRRRRRQLGAWAVAKYHALHR